MWLPPIEAQVVAIAIPLDLKVMLQEKNYLSLRENKLPNTHAHTTSGSIDRDHVGPGSDAPGG